MIERSKIIEKDDSEYGKEYVLLSDARTYGDQRAAEARADALQAMERVPMTDAQSEAAWKKTFSTDNPFCPCNLKSFRKAQKATEAHHNITPPESKG